MAMTGTTIHMSSKRRSGFADWKPQDAVGYERERQNLHLFTDADVVEMTLTKPAPRWQPRMPLRQVYVVDRANEGALSQLA